MKKVFYLLALGFFGIALVNAQEVTFGAKAGLNLANISGDDTDGLDTRTSFHVGAMAEISISEKFSVQPELLYSGQGTKESVEGIDLKINLDYINLPIMGKYYFADRVSLEVGPQVGFLISAKAKAEGEEEDIKEFLKDIDFGLNFGIGYKLDSGLNFSARYNLGLSNIYDDSEFEGFKNQNSVIQFSVGYFF